jgi:hypothetical protein
VHRRLTTATCPVPLPHLARPLSAQLAHFPAHAAEYTVHQSHPSLAAIGTLLTPDTARPSLTFMHNPLCPRPTPSPPSHASTPIRTLSVCRAQQVPSQRERTHRKHAKPPPPPWTERRRAESQKVRRCVDGGYKLAPRRSPRHQASQLHISPLQRPPNPHHYHTSNHALLRRHRPPRRYVWLRAS